MSSTSQVDWSPSCDLRTKLGGTEVIFHPEQYLLILLPLSTKTGFGFKHQNYCFGSGGAVSWAAGVWEGRWGTEGTLSPIPLSCCALCLCAGGIPPAAWVQSRQVGSTSHSTWPNSSPWGQQNETAPPRSNTSTWFAAESLPGHCLPQR